MCELKNRYLCEGTLSPTVLQSRHYVYMNIAYDMCLHSFMCVLEFLQFSTGRRLHYNIKFLTASL